MGRHRALRSRMLDHSHPCRYPLNKGCVAVPSMCDLVDRIGNAERWKSCGGLDGPELLGEAGRRVSSRSLGSDLKTRSAQVRFQIARSVSHDCVRGDDRDLAGRMGVRDSSSGRSAPKTFRVGRPGDVIRRANVP